ncbi:MAG: hypothetical protein HYZ53_29385 [Planctomycetes bacterium]|nr:hypothetical protein [Planctomycetota bacterium]
MNVSPAPRLPGAARIGITAFCAVWIPAYLWYYGPANFLWFCDIALLVSLVGTWREDPLLLSSQLCSVSPFLVLWTVDYFAALLFGLHPIHGTEYMFMAKIPVGIRALSFFHLALLPYLLWAVARVGYDRRGWRLQTGISSVVLPVCYFFTDPEKDYNWVFGPFDVAQTRIHPLLYLVVIMLFYPVCAYLPMNALYSRLFRPTSGAR